MAGRKENLQALFTNARTRVILITTVVLLLLMITIGYFEFRSPTLSSDSGAAVTTGPVGMRSIPGSANQTAQYAFLQEKQNIDQAKTAAKKGGSAIPTLVRSQTFGDGVEAVGPQGGTGALGFSALSRESGNGPQQSLWLQQLRDSHCSNDVVKKVLSEGAGLSTLKRECSCAQLKTNGYQLSELQPICSCPDLKTAGFTILQFKAAGYTAGMLRKCGFNLCDLESAGYTPAELESAGFSPNQLSGAGISENQAERPALPKGMTVAEVHQAGCSPEGLKRLREQGVSALAIRNMNGCTPEQMKAGGYGPQLKQAGFTDAEINPKTSTENCNPTALRADKTKGMSASTIREKYGCALAALKNAGYTAAQLRAAGFTAAELKNAGFSAGELKAAGFNARDLRNAGFDAQQLKAAGFSAGELKAAGFTAKQLKDAGFNARELKAAGFTASDLRNAGFDAQQLKAAGFSASELKEAGFTAKQLKNAGFTADQLKDAGFSARELKDAGYTAADLSAAGFSAMALKNAGYDAAELSSAGFSPAQLRDAGFVIADNIPGVASVPSIGVPTDPRVAQNLANQQRLNAIMAQQRARTNTQQQQQKLQQRTSTMSAAANQALQGWKAGFTQTFVAGSAVVKAHESSITSVHSRTVSESSSTTAVGTKGGHSLIRAGEVIFAVIDTAINSDQPGPILATVVSGRFKGAKLIGSFNLPANADKMVISFNMMSIPGAEKTTSINAYAIDPNTARTALSSRTDHHYLLRYGSLFAATFLEGFGNAFQSQNTTITIGGTGGVSNTTVSNGAGRSILENAVIGLATLGKSWGQVAMQNVHRPTTVDVCSGTGVGILFTQDVMA